MSFGVHTSDMVARARTVEAALLRPLLQLSSNAASLDRMQQGRRDAGRADHLQKIAATFVDGYNLMFEHAPITRLNRVLNECEPERHGFLVEGAAMGATIRDGLSIRGKNLARLRDAHGERFSYLIQVGAGWALARVPWSSLIIRRQLPWFLYALSLDGRGFHDAFFKPDRLERGELCHGRGFAAKAYDQGLGRAVWFVALGQMHVAASCIAAYPVERHNELLSGLGLAMAYAGPAGVEDWHKLLAQFPQYHAAISQGVVFAAAAQAQASLFSNNTNLACESLNLGSAEKAAEFALSQRPEFKPDTIDKEMSLYDGWRHSVQTTLPCWKVEHSR